MSVAQRSAPNLKRLTEVRLGFGGLPLGVEQRAHVAEVSQRVLVFLAQLSSATLERLTIERFGFVELALDLEDRA